MTVWIPKKGELIQIWDSEEEEFEGTAEMENHGDLAHIVREAKKTDTFTDHNGDRRGLMHIKEGEVFKCVLVSDPRLYQVVYVHVDNMRAPTGTKG